jgi:hypothetical protein
MMGLNLTPNPRFREGKLQVFVVLDKVEVGMNPVIVMTGLNTTPNFMLRAYGLIALGLI